MGNVDARPAFEGLIGRGEAEIGEIGVEAVGRGDGMGSCEEITRAYLVGRKSVQVERHTVPSLGALDAFPVDLDAPHAGYASAREHFKFVACGNGAAPERSRDDRARAFDGEDAVDWQASAVGCLLALRRFRRAAKRRLQIVEPLSRAARDGNDFGTLVGPARKAAFHLVDHEFDPFIVDEVGLRERDDECGDAQQLQYGQMLGRLRHDAVICCDAQECHIDAS